MNPTYLAVDTTNLYWLDLASNLQTCPLSGCTGGMPKALATQQGAVGPLEVSDVAVSWVNGMSIWAVAKLEKEGAESRE